MRSVKVKGRYGDVHTFVNIDGTWIFNINCDYFRVGDDFVDPSGGPFVGVGIVLCELHPKLPHNEIITSVDCSNDDDCSYVLTTSKLTKKETKLFRAREKAKAEAWDEFMNDPKNMVIADILKIL